MCKVMQMHILWGLITHASESQKLLLCITQVTQFQILATDVWHVLLQISHHCVRTVLRKVTFNTKCFFLYVELDSWNCNGLTSRDSTRVG